MYSQKLLNFIEENKLEILKKVSEDLILNPDNIEVKFDSLGDVTFSGSIFDHNGISFRFKKDIEGVEEDSDWDKEEVIQILIADEVLCYLEYDI